MIRIDREDDGRRGRFIVDHTGVESYFGGKGYGRLLIGAGVDFARREGLKIVPVCSFVRKSFERDASLADVMA